MNHEVNVDWEGMISLRWRWQKQYVKYLGSEAEDGTITLIPAVLVPAVRLPLEKVPEGPERNVPWLEGMTGWSKKGE